ncbi:hypothetical protein FH972_000515 [Carpinus fangiana]|uniref:Yippee domain-containing protein n=1 Tax=Carpinus fangiana TaxID=176857 RepID=A0A5N6Q9A7_9ROSI|nr:hypothetical protein FH972_000515 [Carpinus fangiana]
MGITNLQMKLERVAAHDKNQKYKEGKFVLERDYFCLAFAFKMLEEKLGGSVKDG